MYAFPQVRKNKHCDMEMADHIRENDFRPLGVEEKWPINPLMPMQTNTGKTITLRMQQNQQRREQP